MFHVVLLFLTGFSKASVLLSTLLLCVVSWEWVTTELKESFRAEEEEVAAARARGASLRERLVIWNLGGASILATN